MSAEQQGFIAARLSDLEAVRKSQEAIGVIQATALDVKKNAESTGRIAGEINTTACEIKAATSEIKVATGEIEAATGRTQAATAGLRAITLISLLLVVFLAGASFYLFRELRATEGRIVDAVNKIKIPAPVVNFEVQQWTSGPFGVGVVKCGVVPGKQEANPCDCWVPVDKSVQRGCASLDTIVRAQGDVSSIIAVGGHDRIGLNAAGKELYGDNYNVAIQRAQTVAKLLRDQLAPRKREVCDPERDPKCIPPHEFVRGTWDQGVQNESDRRVTVTFLRAEHES